MAGNLAETTTHESPKVIGTLGDYFAASVTDTLTLDGSHGTKLVLTPTAARTVLLQPEATRNGVTVFVKNAGAYTLTFKDDSNTTTIGTVGAGRVGYFYCNGTSWIALAVVVGSGAGFMSEVVTGTGTAQQISHGLTGTPTRVWWSVVAGHNGAGSTGDKCPEIDLTGPPDGDNISVSISTGAQAMFYADL